MPGIPCEDFHARTSVLGLPCYMLHAMCCTLYAIYMSHPACCITSHIALSHNFRRAGLCLDCAPRRTDYRIPGSSDISFPGGDGGAGGGARAIRRCRARIQAGAQHALHHPSNLSLTSCCASTSPPRAHHPRVPPSTGPPHPPYQACCLGRWLCTGRCPS